MKSSTFACSIALAAAVLGAVPAQAANTFQVSPSNMDATYTNFDTTPITPFTADQIAGNYNEVITLSGGFAGTFSYSIYWNATQFLLSGNNIVGFTGLTAPGQGGPNQYVMYATLSGTGTYAIDGLGNVSFSPAVGGLFNIYAAHNVSATAPLTGAGAWTLTPTGTQHNLASGTVKAANGEVKNGCPNSDCGSFGVTTGIVLDSPDGPAFFTAPNPFYNISFEAGNFKEDANTQALLAGALAGGTFNVNGGAQVTFARVSEPGALGLVGLGLVAAGLARRRATRTS